MSRALAALCVLFAALAAAAFAPAFDWRLPAGVAPPPVPRENPMSPAKFELGRRLFYEADLSVDGTLACSGCHEQHRAFADGGATRPGVGGAAGRRNVMGLANAGYLSPLTWADPSLRRLEDQVHVPVFGTAPVEMGMAGQEAEIVRRLSADACYRRMFAEAFPAEPDIDMAKVAKALAAFQRTLVSRSAPYDRGVRPGAAAFRRAGCPACHSGPLLTDQRFHVLAPGPDAGLFEKTGRAGDRHAFRTPSLRNVELTGPYLHDGSAATLAAAVAAHGRRLAPADLQAVEDFLLSLTDRAFVEDPRFALPRSFCGEARVR